MSPRWPPVVLGVLLFGLATIGHPTAQTNQPPLLQQSNFTYQGAFRLPVGTSNETSYEYGGTALAYYAAHNSLLMVGHDWLQRVGEVSIPQPVKGTTLDDLPRATVRQPLTDVLKGQIGRVGPGAAKVGGLLPWNDALIVTAYLFYDGAGVQTASHFKSGLDFGHLGELQGPFGLPNIGAGMVSGYMTPVPPEWQAALGGAALTGNCCLNVISRTSLGPAVSVFDPSAVGTKPTIPATELVGYRMPHATLGDCETSGSLVNCTTMMGGVIFPEGTRSVLFFGRRGMGTFCYGAGTPNQALHFTKSPTEEMYYCYDPAQNAKGPHAYPYQHAIWAYDVLDLIAVKAGKKKPWDVRPYASWTFELPFPHPERRINGVAYDPATKRIFVSVAYGDGAQPLIHVVGLN